MTGSDEPGARRDKPLWRQALIGLCLILLGALAGGLVDEVREGRHHKSDRERAADEVRRAWELYYTAEWEQALNTSDEAIRLDPLNYESYLAKAATLIETRD